MGTLNSEHTFYTLKVLQKLMDISSTWMQYMIQRSLNVCSYKTQNTKIFVKKTKNMFVQVWLTW